MARTPPIRHYAPRDATTPILHLHASFDPVAAVTSEATLARDLRRLCDLYGVVTRYHDALGSERIARPEALLAVLRALGARVGHDPTDVGDAIRARNAELDGRVLEPVTVVAENRDGAVILTPPRDRSDRPVHLRLETEEGEVREWAVRPHDLDPVGGDEGHGRTRIRRRLPLPGGPLPRGRHRLTLGPEDATGWILAAPDRAFVPDAMAEGRAWGVFSPLYALRSTRDQHLGRFAELAELRRWVSEMGAHAVGTLPLFATFLDDPFEPSPYLPVSRLFWSELFLETEWILEEDRERMDPSTLPEAPVTSVDPDDPPAGDLVDYRKAARAKRRSLEPLARAFFRGAGEDDPEFRSFLDARPEARGYARFRATGERGPGGDPDPEPVRYHLWVQWQATRQLRRVRNGGGDGADLYLDLPLGVHADGWDVHHRPHLFAREVSVGAPPDRFFREGQNWGFPPLLPQASRSEGHAYTAECLRRSMEACRYLRVDHVMGFQRLFWIPRGMEALDGVYVRYPAPELLALTCLESRRAGTGVVGEDLGTVSPEIPRALEERGISRMHVIQFELPPKPGELPGAVPPGAASSAGTHDTPTFAGFCRGLDLERRVALGRMTEEEARAEKEEREERIGTLKGWLRREGLLEDRDEADLYGFLRGVLRHLARSPAGLVLISLDDLWLEEKRQNIPGQAGDESWRRLHRHTLPEIREIDSVTDALREVARLRARRGRSQG